MTTQPPAAPRPDSLRRTPAPELAVTCPWCHAPAGTRCTGRRGRTHTTSHPSRVDTASAAA